MHPKIKIISVSETVILHIAANVSGLAEVPHATLFKYMHNFSCGILAS